MQNHCLCLALKIQGIEGERKFLIFFPAPRLPQAFELGESQDKRTGTFWYIIEAYLKCGLELHGEKHC